MSSSDSQGESETRFVRTTGLRPPGEGTVEREETDPGEAVRLRERVGELETELRRREARIEELTEELETARRERDDAREWATFLDRELRENRERVGTLESRVEALESRGLVDRLRGLFG